MHIEFHSLSVRLATFSVPGLVPTKSSLCKNVPRKKKEKGESLISMQRSKRVYLLMFFQEGMVGLKFTKDLHFHSPLNSFFKNRHQGPLYI